MPSTVILTGASRGIGRAAAQFLLADGANVVTVQRSISPELEKLAEKYPKALRNVLGDFSEPAVITRAIQEALNTFGSVDAVVFNAAAGGALGPVTELSEEGWQKAFEVNVFGVVRFLRKVLPVMKDGSRIIFISSAAAEMGIPAAGPYSATKAALNSLNRTVAAENPGKIAISLHPGTTSTQMQQDFASQAKDYLPESVVAQLAIGVNEPEVPGRVIANLALRGGAELSGKYLHYDAPEIASI